MRASTEKNGEIGIANCLCDYVLSGVGTIRSIHLHVQCTSAAIVFTIDLMIAFQKWYLRHISSYNSYHQIVRMFYLFALLSPTQHCCPPFGTKLDINSILEVSHNCNCSTTATAATLFLFVCSISVSTATIKYKPIILSRKWLTKKCEEKWYNKSHSK